METVKFNKLLDEQIRKYLGDDFNVPDQFQSLFSVISQSYDHHQAEQSKKSKNGNGQIIESQTSDLKNEIKSRKITESALRYSESTKAAILNAIPDSMYIVDKNGVILDFYSAERGVTKEKYPEAIGTSLAKYIDPSTARKGLALIRQTIKKPISELLITSVNSRGRPFNKS